MPSREGVSPAEIYEYLAKAREKVIAAARSLTLEQYTQEFPFGLKTLRDTLVEIPIAESNYVRRIQGEEVPKWDDHPYARLYKTDFAALERAWREQADETRRVLRSVTDWSRPLDYVARPTGRRARRIRTTAGGVATQLMLHEVHHRAQAMAMLRQLGSPVESIDYSILAYQIEELPE